jgi:hypothetical protein
MNYLYFFSEFFLFQVKFKSTKDNFYWHFIFDNLKFQLIKWL